MTFRDELIAVYARTPVSDIGNSAAYQTLCAGNTGDSRFDRERDLVETAKSKVEIFLAPPKTQQEEARAALTLLARVRGEKQEVRDRYYDLIVAGYQSNWTAAQQQYFATAWNKIRSRYEFFLSFTTRFDVPGENPVNTNYRHFIRHVLGGDEFEKADRKKTNLLAQAAYRLLKSPDWPAFLFTHSQYDNSETETKLAEACKECLVFVQLVQNIMFVAKPGATNYCHFEYLKTRDHFKGDPDRSKHVLFVVAENDPTRLVAPLNVPLDYSDWHSEITGKDPPYLEKATTYKVSRIEQLSKLFEEKVKPQIRDALHRIVNGVPAN